MGAEVKMLARLLLLLAFLLPALPAESANRFGVCTVTCTWDGSSTAMWSTTTGGATGASVPGSSDAVIFDGATCVGGVTCTITVNTNVTVISITADACTASTNGCIVDFSVNNNTVTVSGNSPAFSFAGSGTRQLKLGTATIALSGTSAIFDVSGTNITFTGGSSTVQFTSTAVGERRIFGNRTFGTIAVGGSSAPFLSFFGACTITTFALTAPVSVKFNSSSVVTVTNALTISGSLGSAPTLFYGGTPGGAGGVISSANNATLNWVTLRDMTFQGGGTFAANNSLDAGNNSGITITPPSVVAAGYMIGAQ